MDKKTELKAIIEAFENGKENVQLTLNRIKQLTGKDVTANEIIGYWTYTSLDVFCENLATEPITDWANIDDDRALLLIKEIFANVTKDNIVHRNSEALAKRYRKTTGFISDIVFHSDLTDEPTILAMLKKDTTIYL